ncbi:MAG TPA: pectate lyase, partial [Chitinophagaceae bacterium]|nr:pectate lyase [Chitinophagaceae bacterium]
MSFTKTYKKNFLFLTLLIVQQALLAQKPEKPVVPLSFEKGTLIYAPDSLGNRIPDFSYCGYKASEQPIPTIPVKIVVPVTKGDATLRIQSALDYVASLPLDANGFRGAVLLQKGTYEVFGQLRIIASGVVLRGSGVNATTIVGAGIGRLALIKIVGKNDIPRDLYELKITDIYVPVNALKFNVDSSILFKQHSNKIIIRRPSTANWIKVLGTDHFGGGITALGWKPGDRDLFFDRTITKKEGTTITIDAPLTTALDTTYGGASIYFYNGTERINNCGIENLSCLSTYDKANPKDEDHR